MMVVGVELVGLDLCFLLSGRIYSIYMFSDQERIVWQRTRSSRPCAVSMAREIQRRFVVEIHAIFLRGMSK